MAGELFTSRARGRENKNNSGAASAPLSSYASVAHTGEVLHLRIYTQDPPNASVTLDQIPCGSPEDPPGARAYTRGILWGSAGDFVQCGAGIALLRRSTGDPHGILSSVTPALGLPRQGGRGKVLVGGVIMEMKAVVLLLLVVYYSVALPCLR